MNLKPLGIVILFAFPLMLLADDANSPKTREFFALCMDTHDEKQRTIEEQNAMLAELGFDGVAHLWLDKLNERAASAKTSKLNVSQVYFQIDLSKNPPFDQNLEKTLPCLKEGALRPAAGGKTQLALLIYGGKPSDESLDDKAFGIVRDIVRIAEPNDVTVVLYPHGGAWNETVADNVRLAKRFPEKNVGVMFNLCHWVAMDKSENLRKTLELALPYLACITINGTDTPEEIQTRADRAGWLQPLDAGSFDQKKLLTILDELGYRGPVGLQCYGIPGDAKVHLERSMKKWRDMQ